MFDNNIFRYFIVGTYSKITFTLKLDAVFVLTLDDAFVAWVKIEMQLKVLYI